ncbi:uncharacterized protein LOC141496667 [Macrotis lagotis]|uniref:uncharacterized protein LOC141496667 n=1 Tax=Macrotis lagotis TaxID=92651 RepID=UPI003D69D888
MPGPRGGGSRLAASGVGREALKLGGRRRALLWEVTLRPGGHPVLQEECLGMERLDKESGDPAERLRPQSRRDRQPRGWTRRPPGRATDTPRVGGALGERSMGRMRRPGFPNRTMLHPHLGGRCGGKQEPETGSRCSWPDPGRASTWAARRGGSDPPGRTSSGCGACRPWGRTAGQERTGRPRGARGACPALREACRSSRSCQPGLLPECARMCVCVCVYMSLSV